LEEVARGDFSSASAFFREEEEPGPFLIAFKYDAVPVPEGLELVMLFGLGFEAFWR